MISKEEYLDDLGIKGYSLSNYKDSKAIFNDVNTVKENISTITDQRAKLLAVSKTTEGKIRAAEAWIITFQNVWSK